MNARTIIAAVAVVLAVGLPYWMILPLLTDFFLMQAMFGFVVYMLEIALMTSLIMAIIDGRLRLIMAAAAIGFLIGVAPGVAPLPTALFLPMWLKAVIPSILLGALISRGGKAGKAFGLAAVLMAIFLAMTYLQSGGGLVEQINHMNDSIEKMITGPMGGGYSQDTANKLTDQLLYMTRILTRLLPGLIIMAGIGQLFVAFIITEWYYTRRDSYFPGFGPFIYWKVPEKVLYFLGVVLIARLVINGVVQIAADNIAFVLFVLYAVCGLALAEYALRRLRLPVIIRAVFYIGLGLMHIIGLIAASVAGLFDSYFDFRRVRAHTLG